MVILYLNMMRDRYERLDPIAVANTKGEIEAWLEQNKAPEPYKDGSTSSFGVELVKTYAKGSILEYYNPPGDREECWHYFPGRQEFLDAKAKEYDNFLATIHKIGL